MRQINIHEAKTHLSRLVDEAADGEEIVIAKAGKPVARLVALEPARQPRVPGLLKDKIWIADDFDAPLPEEILALFEGPI
jgi:prevent-host-death family protein